ncbi:MAG: HPP family protein [Arthrobacter sp.]|nr:HPP family protein [Arthrobacter sp.]
MLSPSPKHGPVHRLRAVGRAAFRRPGQPKITLRTALLGALATAATLGFLGVVGTLTGSQLLVAGFASSCVLAFMLPGAALAHPINVMGGHLVAGVCGLTIRFLLPAGWPSAIAAVLLSMLVMALLGVLHPPAGGNPLAIVLAQEQWSYLVAPVLVGALAVGFFTWAYAWLAKRIRAGASDPLG